MAEGKRVKVVDLEGLLRLLSKRLGGCGLWKSKNGKLISKSVNVDPVVAVVLGLTLNAIAALLTSTSSPPYVLLM